MKNICSLIFQTKRSDSCHHINTRECDFSIIFQNHQLTNTKKYCTIICSMKKDFPRNEDILMKYEKTSFYRYYK